ncbi:MAG: hypothetical protein A2882_11230 [Phenylobacterium sp. RIFCSPHIGHO2_01_FULL_70_10]|nr:MAG: hypothetical protein A2882_11230 [Phenylobacterium sp. RIFCSPHIGHO2_01_FULL_70_10]
MLRALDAVEADLNDPLLARQFELEAEMIEEGRHRYWDRVNRTRPGTDANGRFTEGEESRSPTSQCLLRLALNPVKDGVEAFLAAAKTGKAGRRHVAVKHLELVEPEVSAFLAVKTCLDAFSLNLGQGTLCVRIGRALEDEVRLRTFEAKAGGLLHRIRERFKTANFKHHRRVLNALAQRYEIDLGPRWSETEALHTGAALLTCVLERTGLFEIVHEQQGAERRTTVRPTEQTLEWVRNRDAAAQFLFPTFMPLVVKPREWTTPFNGGYHFGLARKLKLVKNHRKGYQAELRSREMPAVYRAVNALQNTAWCVNGNVLALMSEAARAGSSLGGLPDTRQEDIPPAPADIPEDKDARTPEQQARLNAWKTTVRETYEANLERRQKALVVARTIAIAEKYADEERFYFPYTLDFRGRAYPAASFLQPQGCDYQKALLQFADGKPLGHDGACWLAIHGANLMAEDPHTGQKLDKAPLQERIDWVFANEDKIAAVAADPHASDWWTLADCPWQFLAFCFEWAGYMREGETFVSHLPVALDGSCNGLQHFSAMLRDEVGGSAVNLIPHERPADIYMEVRNKAVEVCERDAAGDDPEKAKVAKAWLASGQIDRGLCKRPVMTMPYGSKQFGIRDQLVTELRKRGFEFHDPETGEVSDGWAECGYLAAAIWEALGGVVVKAREAMDWLQTCARLAAKAELPINWTTPAGLPIQQDYREMHSKKVKTQVAGVLLWPRLQEETDTVSKTKQQNGMAPNFVHSMDASAMMLCINEALDAGIESFAMIHDSYATHAADTHVFYGCIRQSFIRMYTDHDVLSDFRRDIAYQLPPELVAELPPVPRPGDLDLTLVAESDFFFA